MKLLKQNLFGLILITLATIFICLLVPSISYVSRLPEFMVLANADFDEIKIKNVSYEISDNTIAAFSDSENSEKTDFLKLILKLFNIVPMKTVDVKLEPERKAFLGGYPIGLSVKSDGVMVLGTTSVETLAGAVTPDSEILIGDIITEINGRKVLYISDIMQEMADYNADSKVVEIKILRLGAEKKILSYPIKEELSGSYKLGVAVKDCVDGVGTVSYVRPDGRFGCLGHPINIYGSKEMVPCYNGNAYECKITGYNKGGRGRPGELKGSFVNTNKPIGEIYKNNTFGIFGKLDKYDNTNLMDIGSRFSVKMGAAQILTTIDSKPVYYDIEILKTHLQNSPQDKGMVIRVCDKELLKTTGGILQGMSGSPIIQDNKIVGCVTHVFVNDSTKGYGMYLDWMYNN